MQESAITNGRAAQTGRLRTDIADRIVEHVRAQYRAFDLPVADSRPGGIELDAGIGKIRFSASGSELLLRIWAESASNAFMLREAAVARIEAFDPALVSGLRWNASASEGSLPPNFRQARILRISTVGPFRRLEIEADDLDAFDRDGLHLRMALPLTPDAPNWPRVDGAGRTIWPDDLHVAVYTIRHVDPAAGRLTVDVFHHGRGGTCAWIDTARPGMALGLVGPGGGWFPKGGWLTLAGDETASPAIARIAEAAPGETRGTILMETESGADDYPVEVPAGMTLRRLSRARGETLEQGLAGIDPGPAGDRYVWIAAERDRATALRQEMTAAHDLGRQERYIAAYWSA